MENNSYSRNDLVGTCPACKTLHTLEDAQNQALTKGVALAICGETIFQVVDCHKPECGGKVELRSDTNNPALDVRNLILVPDYHGLGNEAEQEKVLSNRKKWHDYLKFKIIPAWDEDSISIQKTISPFYNPAELDEDSISAQEFITNGLYTYLLDIPLFLTEDDFYDRLNQERSTKEIRLRRLVPDTPKFSNLLILLAPVKKTRGNTADDTSLHDPTTRIQTLKSLIEEAEGQTFAEAVKNKLITNNIEPPDPSEINNLVGKELYKVFSFEDTLWDIVRKKGFSENLDGFFKIIFRSIFHLITTELALANNREKLLSWHSEVKKGRALFVDAPMGLGKTYSIVEVLVSNPQLSAVIFMPTNKLCDEMVEKLKERIAVVKKVSADWGFIEYKEEIKDERGECVRDDNGICLYRFKRDFLKEEVYFVDGINPQECPKYEDIISLYQKNWFKKRSICKECGLLINCRFRRHDENAYYSRIIITTHHQYDNKRFNHWDKNGKKKPKPRDLFIIDEDIVFSQLYQPITTDYRQLKAFVGTINSYLQEDNSTTDLRESIDLLFSRIGVCDKTSIIRAIDPNFEFPKSLIIDWENSLPGQPFIIPEYIQRSGIVGNHLKVIEHAIKFGAVVEKWGKGKLYKIHLPNPRSYDLSEAPPHVFFDGTMFDNKFLSKKLSGVKFENFSIKIKPIWETNIYQNTNSDLPQRWVEQDKSKVL
ncbi:MAG TPA: hypothetical protein DCE80_16100, partial [Ignavibacteriales bacterium]|nr:hypothetical protein [Ignavibacteriales bacterium]